MNNNNFEFNLDTYHKYALSERLSDLYSDNPEYNLYYAKIKEVSTEAEQAFNFLTSLYGADKFTLLAQEKAVLLAIKTIDDLLERIPVIVKEEAELRKDEKEKRLQVKQGANKIFKDEIEPQFDKLMESINKLHGLGGNTGLSKEMVRMIDTLIKDAPLSPNDYRLYHGFRV